MREIKIMGVAGFREKSVNAPIAQNENEGGRGGARKAGEASASGPLNSTRGFVEWQAAEMRKSESETEKVSEGGTWTGGRGEGGKRVRMAVRAFRARLRLLKRNREKKKWDRERENTERKKEGTKRGVIVQGESEPYGEERREGKPRLQHCKRQRCTLPGGRSDNMYRGPPATMAYLSSRDEREKDA